MKKILSLLLCSALLAGLFAGCSNGDETIDFIYPFDGNISSFDPQIAGTADEYLIAENCFEGLVRVLDDGTVQAGVAESWNISDDGLTYTFYLRKGAKWNVQSDNPEKPTKAQQLMGVDFNPDITANDFAFALKRACSKTTNSPLFASVSNIVNASKVYSGSVSDSQLGVKAIDDYTLEIRLESPDKGFLNTLSTAVAMPCNENYFYATKGRYGLGLDYTIFNGQFYVSSILDASYILKNNKKYIGDYPSKVTDITLNITNADSNIPKNLKSGYYDCAYISGKEYEELGSSDMTAAAYANKTWAMILNKNKQLFTNKLLRQALCMSVSNPDTANHSYLENASNLIPPSCSLGGESISDAMGTTVYKQNTDEAKSLWKKGLEETGFTNAELTLIITADMEDTAKALVQGIQSGIGSVSTYGDEKKISFSLKIEILSSDDFNKAFSNGEYDIALYPLTADNQNPVSFLEKIINGNYAGEIDDIQTTLDKAKNASANELAQACMDCEKQLLEDYSLLPVLFESSYYVQAKGVSGVQFHAGSGRVCFVNAERKD